MQVKPPTDYADSGRTFRLTESGVGEKAPRKIGQHFVLPQYHLSVVMAQARDYGRRAARTGPMHSVDEINASLNLKRDSATVSTVDLNVL